MRAEAGSSSAMSKVCSQRAPNSQSRPRVADQPAVLDDPEARRAGGVVAFHEAAVRAGLQCLGPPRPGSPWRTEGRERRVTVARFAHRQGECRRSGRERERDGFGRRPEQRPQAVGEREPDAVSGREMLRNVVQLQAYAVAPSRFQRLGVFVAVAVGQVEHAIGHAGGRAVGRDIVEARDQKGVGPVGRDVRFQHRRAHDLHRLGQGLRLEHDGAAVVLALVAGRVGDEAVLAPFALAQPHGHGRAYGDGTVPAFRRAVERAGRAEVKRAARDAPGRPRRLRDPAARMPGAPCRRAHAVLHPDPVDRLVHDPVVDALEPAIPPAQGFLEEPDARTRFGKMGIFVGPWPHQPLLRTGQARQHARNGIGVAVGPAAHGVDGGLDVGVVLDHRAVLPLFVAPLVAKPLDQPGIVGLEAGQPLLAPVRHDRGVRRARVHREHGRRPGHRVVDHDPAHVVDVVAVAVVGRGDGDDGLELGWPPRGDLQAVEAAPGDADHAAGAGAPGLRRDPGQDLHRVVLFGLEVLVLEDAAGFPRAPDVDAQAGITVAGPVGMGQFVALARPVEPAVGQVLENCRHRVALRVLGEPDPRREPRAVGERYPGILDYPRRAREPGHRLQVVNRHRRIPRLAGDTLALRRPSGQSPGFTARRGAPPLSRGRRRRPPGRRFPACGARPSCRGRAAGWPRACRGRGSPRSGWRVCPFRVGHNAR